MAFVRVIPVLPLYRGGLNKTRQFKPWKYLGDPVNVVRIFNEKLVDEICLLDIRASQQGRDPDVALIGDIAAEAFMPLSYGGGIRTMEHIQSILAVGVEKVVLGSILHEDMSLLTRAERSFGAQSLVACIEVKRFDGKPRVVSRSGTRSGVLDPVAFALRAVEAGAGELFINDIDRDGMKAGYDLALIAEIARAAPVPIIACGGARHLGDLRAAVDAGAQGVAAGSLFTLIGRLDAPLVTYPPANDLSAVFRS
jgi:cyclase